MKKAKVLKSIWISGLACVIVSFLVFYVCQVIAVTQERFLVTAYQKKIDELSEANKTLEIDFSQVSSFNNIEDIVEELNFVRADKVHYVRVLDNAVAAK